MGGDCSKAKKTTVTDADIDSFIARIRPLDLIVFKGGEGVSSLISAVEQHEQGNGSVTHVEVAINRIWCRRIKPGVPETLVDDELLSWGSTLSGPLNDGVYNAETGKSKFGVQIRKLRTLIKEYISDPNANVGVCSLLENPTTKHVTETYTEYSRRSFALKDAIDKCYLKYNGTQYDVNLLSLLGAMFPSLRPLRNATNELIDLFGRRNPWLFCSEFAAAFYIAIGVIDDDTDGTHDDKTLNPEDIVPVDFLGIDKDTDGLIRPVCRAPIWIK